MTITANWGDDYDFDVAVTVDHAATTAADPVKAGTSSGGALVTCTPAPAQLPVSPALKAYAHARFSSTKA